MKNLIFVFSLCLLFLSKIGNAQNNPDKEIMVLFSEGISQEVKTLNGQTVKAAKITSNQLKRTLNSIGINDTLIEVALPKFVKADTLKTLSNGQTLNQPDMTKLYKIKVPNGRNRQDIIESLKLMPEVLYAEPNGKVVPHVIPSDTRFGDQWGLKNTLHPGADIHAEAAWNIYTGNSNNIIAIVDGGTLSTHEDLNDKISGGDVGYGWNGHGIHVSGIAAAESNNIQGISGVDWQARIHPQRVDNAADDAAIYQAIVDAVNYNSNVKVLNNSWGLTDKDNNPGRYSTTVRQAFAYAYKANRTSVASMGNDQQTHPGVVGYPAGFENIISVGATDNTDLIGYFSDQNSHIDVCAPGVDILSTIDGGYGYMTGTSMAAPHVSGIASLLKGFNPNLANDDIENIIRLCADKVAGMNGQNFTNAYGFGRVNAERALNFLREPYSLNQWTASGGTVASSSGNYTIQFLGAPGLASANYIAKRYEVRVNVTFPRSFCSINGVWGRGVNTGGWGALNPNFGEGFCEIIPGTLTSTGATLRTYVYQIWSVSGQELGYYPNSPSNATFAYTVLGVVKPNASIYGTPSVCTSGSTFTVTGLPSGYSVAWDKSSNLTYISGQNTNSYIVKSDTNGSGWIQATISGTCGSITLPQYPVWCGIPTIPTSLSNVYNGIQLRTNQYYNTSVSTSASQAVNQYYWEIYGANIISGQGTNNLYYQTANRTGSFYIQVKVGNACGWNNTPLRVNGTLVESIPHIALYPNPANTSVEVSLIEDQATTQDSTDTNVAPVSIVDNITTNYNVSIYNSFGNKVYTSKHTGSKFSLPVNNLKDGTYIIEVSDGKNSYRNQLIVKH